MYLFGGSAAIKDHDETIAEGDSILIRKEQLTLQSEVDSDIVFFELDESAPYTRNGLYTKIGRASCRERVQCEVGGVAGEDKRQRASRSGTCEDSGGAAGRTR